MSLLEVVEEARPYRVQASCIRLRPEIERGRSEIVVFTYKVQGIIALIFLIFFIYICVIATFEVFFPIN
jgi:hypothetical protein